MTIDERRSLTAWVGGSAGVDVRFRSDVPPRLGGRKRAEALVPTTSESVWRTSSSDPRLNARGTPASTPGPKVATRSTKPLSRLVRNQEIMCSLQLQTIDIQTIIIRAIPRGNPLFAIIFIGDRRFVSPGRIARIRKMAKVGYPA